MQILRDITQDPQLLRTQWSSLTPEHIADLLSSGQLKKRLNYHLNMSGEGIDSGMLQLQLAYVHVQPATEEGEEIRTSVHEGEWLNINLTGEQIGGTLQFGITTFAGVAEQIIALYGGMPDIIIRTAPVELESVAGPQNEELP